MELMTKPPDIRDPDGTVRPDMINRGDDHRTFRISLCDLSFIRIDHQTRLQFGGTEVVIESPFVLEVSGNRYELDPGERATLGPVLSLYPDSLSSASVDNAGTLFLRFASGATIRVDQDPQFEAWQVNGPGNCLVVCTPGTTGDLAICDEQH